ncbi:MAG: DUF2062 domain-containing protein [Rubrivivax sp.]|nr:DUF2062 domain-containing protein [Rubrivivax sp.]
MNERLRRLLPTREAISRNRWLRWLGPALLHPRLWHVSRRGIATGAGIGVFFAFLIPIAQIPLSAAAAVALRANVPAAVVATLVNSPLTFAPVYYAAWRVGSAMLGEPADDANAPPITSASEAPPAGDTRSGWRHAWHSLTHVGKPLLLGALTFACVFGLAAYLLVNGGWHLHVRLKRRARLRRRQAAP